MTVRVGVVTFPGSLDDSDASRAVRLAGAEPVALWHASDSLDVDAVILPGGFSYGDYLRCGAIARFSPVMGEVIRAGRRGHARARHLQRLPGALRGAPAARRPDPQRPCGPSSAATRSCGSSPPTRSGPATSRPASEIVIALKNGEGDFQADAETVKRLEGENRVVFRYLDVNPNGSINDIAGITNERGNVVGLMPHPEHNVEELSGASIDGLGFFTSVAALPRRHRRLTAGVRRLRGQPAASTASPCAGVPAARRRQARCPGGSVSSRSGHCIRR